MLPDREPMRTGIGFAAAIHLPVNGGCYDLREILLHPWVCGDRVATEKARELELLQAAGLGADAQAVTHGRQIKLPSETVLNFALQTPVSILPAQNPNSGP